MGQGVRPNTTLRLVEDSVPPWSVLGEFRGEPKTHLERRERVGAVSPMMGYTNRIQS